MLNTSTVVQNEKYLNKEKHFESYFVAFDSGARLELMKNAGNSWQPQTIPSGNQYQGIIHICFGMENMDMVNSKFNELTREGYEILSGTQENRRRGTMNLKLLIRDNNRIEVSAIFVE